MSLVFASGLAGPGFASPPPPVAAPAPQTALALALAAAAPALTGDSAGAPAALARLPAPQQQWAVREAIDELLASEGEGEETDGDGPYYSGGDTDGDCPYYSGGDTPGRKRRRRLSASPAGRDSGSHWLCADECPPVEKSEVGIINLSPAQMVHSALRVSRDGPATLAKEEAAALFAWDAPSSGAAAGAGGGGGAGAGGGARAGAGEVGYWAYFFPASDVDDVWRRVAVATARGRLSAMAVFGLCHTCPQYADASLTAVPPTFADAAGTRSGAGRMAGPCCYVAVPCDARGGAGELYRVGGAIVATLNIEGDLFFRHARARETARASQSRAWSPPGAGRCPRAPRRRALLARRPRPRCRCSAAPRGRRSRLGRTRMKSARATASTAAGRQLRCCRPSGGSARAQTREVPPRHPLTRAAHPSRLPG